MACKIWFCLFVIVPTVVVPLTWIIKLWNAATCSKQDTNPESIQPRQLAVAVEDSRSVETTLSILFSYVCVFWVLWCFLYLGLHLHLHTICRITSFVSRAGCLSAPLSAASSLFAKFSIVFSHLSVCRCVCQLLVCPWSWIKHCPPSLLRCDKHKHACRTMTSHWWEWSAAVMVLEHCEVRRTTRRHQIHITSAMVPLCCVWRIHIRL